MIRLRSAANCMHIWLYLFICGCWPVQKISIFIDPKDGSQNSRFWSWTRNLISLDMTIIFQESLSYTGHSPRLSLAAMGDQPSLQDFFFFFRRWVSRYIILTNLRVHKSSVRSFCPQIHLKYTLCNFRQKLLIKIIYTKKRFEP